MEYDIVIVGAGPAGLSAACRIKQLSSSTSVCVIEKGSEVGAHIISGTIFEPTAINELFPNWKNLGAPLNTNVKRDEVLLMLGKKKALKIPELFVPKTLHNEGNYIISLGNLCRWLSEQAESLGVEIYPSFSGAEILYNDDGSVGGIITGDMGVSANHSQKSTYTPGIELRGKYTLFAEGCRGHLGKQLIEKFRLNQGKDPQHYGIGIKEIWKVSSAQHEPGLVMHTTGWPLSENGAVGGGFMYHIEDTQISIGLITDLAYDNPRLSPFEEFQRYKQHPSIKQFLEGGERISYGARAIAKGGLQSLPKMTFPGGVLIGCNAGTLNAAKIKGSHCAMKSGMLAAEVAHKAINEQNRANDELTELASVLENSWLYKELYTQRNFAPAQHKFGNLIGSAYAFIDLNIFNGKLPWTLQDPKPDHAMTRPTQECQPIHYPKPDNKITFDRLSSVFLSNTNHEEDQPCHLKLENELIPIQHNLPVYGEPAQHYCPAGVYEVIKNESGDKKFQINSQNCVHCKTCDIKDPSQNITWITPEGGGGPNYPSM